MSEIDKEFPGVKALNKISFDLRPGEVHVILGENGAGKSTLMKVLSGIYTPTRGTVEVNGKTYDQLNPKLSKDLGIATIFQELSVINELSIAENMFIGNLMTKKKMKILNTVDYTGMNKKAAEALDRLGVKLDVTKNVSEISISEKQLVEIAKALMLDARVIIMDEPTSSLTLGETKLLFDIIRKLKKDNVGIVYISHKLDEIKQIGDRVTVLKDGCYVDTKDVRDINTKDMVSMMVGRELSEGYGEKKAGRIRHNDSVLLSVKNISREDKKIENISFDLMEGEILGFAGLIGSGRTELMEALFGAVKASGGEISYKGTKLVNKSPFDAVKNGIALITENRRETGFFHNFPIWKNVSITHEVLKSGFGGLTGLVNDKKDRKMSNDQKALLSIKCTSVDQSITDLSGGNQQKVIIGKWLCCDPNVLIFDEPTRGIDVGAKCEIYSIIQKLSAEGKGTIVVSSELPELLSICDRIIVFNSGKIAETIPIEVASEENIMMAATKRME